MEQVENQRVEVYSTPGCIPSEEIDGDFDFYADMSIGVVDITPSLEFKVQNRPNMYGLLQCKLERLIHSNPLDVREDEPYHPPILDVGVDISKLVGVIPNPFYLGVLYFDRVSGKVKRRSREEGTKAIQLLENTS